MSSGRKALTSREAKRRAQQQTSEVTDRARRALKNELAEPPKIPEPTAAELHDVMRASGAAARPAVIATAGFEIGYAAGYAAAIAYMTGRL